jgi:hypothetical protein
VALVAAAPALPALLALLALAAARSYWRSPGVLSSSPRYQKIKHGWEIPSMGRYGKIYRKH